MKRVITSILIVVCVLLSSFTSFALEGLDGYIMDGTHYYPKQELYIDYDNSGDNILYTAYCGSHDCIETLETRDKYDPMLVNEIQELLYKGFTKVIDSTGTANLTEKPTNPATKTAMWYVVSILFVLGVVIYVRYRKTIRKTSR